MIYPCMIYPIVYGPYADDTRWHCKVSNYVWPHRNHPAANNRSAAYRSLQPVRLSQFPNRVARRARLGRKQTADFSRRNIRERYTRSTRHEASSRQNGPFFDGELWRGVNVTGHRKEDVVYRSQPHSRWKGYQ